MSFKFHSIDYLGSYSNIQKFISTWVWNYEVKNVGGNKLFLKFSEESRRIIMLLC